METKKSPRADLGKKTTLFFSMGLLVAMSVVLMAFEWKHQPQFLVLPDNFDNPLETTLDVPLTEVTPPQPPPLVAPVIVEANEDEVIEDIKLIVDVETEPQVELPVIAAAEVEPEHPDIVFTVVEEPATPVGGVEAFYQEISKKIKYPPHARRMEITGKVYVEFIIAKDGAITEARVTKGIGAGCDEEALRVVQSAPAWKPAKQRGVPVRQRITIPIIFKIK